MIKIAIVEDEKDDSDRLVSFIGEYLSKENTKGFATKVFSEPLAFLKSWSFEFQVIFLDIRMPQMDGMELAKKIREKDKNVILVFITSLGQYAIKGYEVEALDFIVKPLIYDDFALKFARIIKRIPTCEEKSLILTYHGDSVKINANKITYVESFKHKVIYHLEGGESQTTLGTLKEASERLKDEPFSMCNKCYLVNLQYVTKVDENFCYVGDDELLISRPRKKEFKESFIRYLQGERKCNS